jgi:hypothetical protein
VRAQRAKELEYDRTLGLTPAPPESEPAEAPTGDDDAD